jgi:hypothetical protein
MSAALTRAAMKMDGRTGLHELAMIHVFIDLFSEQ